MPRKRRLSTTSLDDDEDDYSEKKYEKDDIEERAPRNAANARERARMRVLSKAFCKLKTTLPWVPADTKLSKLDTLRLAATYIAHLRAVLREDGDSHPDSTRSLSLSLSWPFAVQGNNPPIFLNNNCAVTSTSSASSPEQIQYNRPHHQIHQDIQNYHPNNHHNMSNHSHQDRLFY